MKLALAELKKEGKTMVKNGKAALKEALKKKLKEEGEKLKSRALDALKSLAPGMEPEIEAEFAEFNDSEDEHDLFEGEDELFQGDDEDEDEVGDGDEAPEEDGGDGDEAPEEGGDEGGGEGGGKAGDDTGR